MNWGFYKTKTNMDVDQETLKKPTIDPQSQTPDMI